MITDSSDDDQESETPQMQVSKAAKTPKTLPQINNHNAALALATPQCAAPTGTDSNGICRHAPHLSQTTYENNNGNGSKLR